MKLLFTFIIFSVCFSLKAQQLSYRIDYWKPDSIYLVEIKQQQAKDGGADIQENKWLLRDTSEIGRRIYVLHSQAEKSRQQAGEIDKISTSIQELYAALRARLIQGK